MKTTKYLLICITFCFVYTSCLRYPCGGFPDNLKGWVPYKIGDVLRFQSDSDQIVFEIDSVEKTIPYLYDGGIEGGCFSEYNIWSVKNKYPYISGYCGKTNMVGVHYFIYFEETKLNQLNFIYYPNKQIIKDHTFKFDTISYQLKNSIVKDVIAIEKIKPPYNPDVNKIFVHNGKGLVGFIKNGREYKLVE
jgi:hypothetical protein